VSDSIERHNMRANMVSAAKAMRRIGRPAAPGESTMQMVRERADMRDHIGWMVWTDVTKKGHTMQAREEWNAMSQHDRDTWIDRAVALMAEDCAQYDAEHPPRGPDDDPNGGLPLPIARIA
jgi:hypothetical protein